MRRGLHLSLITLVTACGLLACDQQDSVIPATQFQSEPEVAPQFKPVDSIDISAEAKTTLQEIQSLVETGSLRRLARYADTHNGFVSNFGTEANYDYWYLLRRTGAEPLDQLIRILNEPHGELKLGDRSWYVWPDFAALDVAMLDPDRMDINLRGRLVSLIGESGIEDMRNGAPYPGVRTAISDDGRWIYWLFETGDTQNEDEEQ